MGSAKQISLWAVLIGILIAALYGQFLHNPLVFDDMYYFMLDKDGHSAIERFVAHGAIVGVRTLPFATIAWTTRWLGFELAPLRIENLLLHWLVVVALAVFVLRLYRMVLPEAQQGENTAMVTAVLVVVSLFALHPIAVYAVGYLNERTIVMAMLFAVLTLWAYLKGSADNSKAWLWASVVLYFLATHSKEHVVMLPAVIVALAVLINQDWRNSLRKNWPVFAAYAVVGLATTVQAKYAIGSIYETDAVDMMNGIPAQYAYPLSMMTQSGLFFKYGLLWLLPNPGWMSVDMREPFAHGFFSIYSASLVAYLLYGLVALRLLLKRGRTGLIGFALLFPWLMFATELVTVRFQEIFVLYRSYIWALGGVMLLPLLLMRLNARLTIAVSVLIGATFFMVSMERLESFSHPIVLWDDAEKLVKDRQELPGVWRIYYNRGTAYLNASIIDSAISDLQRAGELNPKMSVIFGNLGAAYSKMGQNEQTINALSRAIKIDQQNNKPPNANYYSGRAGAYEKSGQRFKAAVDYKVVCLLANKGCDKADQLLNHR